MKLSERKVKVELTDEALRLEIPKEFVVDDGEVAVVVIDKSDLDVAKIPDEQLRECGETLASAYLVLIKARRLLEKGKTEEGEKLLASAPVLLIQASKACKVEFPSELSHTVFHVERPKDIESIIEQALDEAREEFKRRGRE